MNLFLYQPTKVVDIVASSVIIIVTCLQIVISINLNPHSDDYSEKHQLYL